MRLIKPKFWETKNFISFILYPLSAITYLINITKKFSNKKNFKEIYTFLKKLKMSSSTSNILKMENLILKRLNNKTPNKNIKKIIKIGDDVLEKNLFYINKYLI